MQCNIGKRQTSALCSLFHFLFIFNFFFFLIFFKKNEMKQNLFFFTPQFVTFVKFVFKFGASHQCEDILISHFIYYIEYL